MTLIRGLRIIETDAGVVAADEHHVMGESTGDFVDSLATAGGGSVDAASVRRLTRPMVSIGSRGTIYKNGAAQGLMTGQISGHPMVCELRAGILHAVYGNWSYGAGVATGNDLYVECAFVHPSNSDLIYQATTANGAKRATIEPGGIVVFSAGMPNLPDGSYTVEVRTWYATPADDDDVPCEWSSALWGWRTDSTADGLLDPDLTQDKPNDNYFSPIMLCGEGLDTPDTPCLIMNADSNLATHDGLNFFERALALLDDPMPWARLAVAGGGLAGYIEVGAYGNPLAGATYWQLARMAGATHAVLAGYTNALGLGGAALIAQTEDTISQLALLGYEGVIICTAPPHTAQFDPIEYKTPAEQTIDAPSQVARVTLHTALRAGDFTSALPYAIADVTTAIEANVSDVLTLDGGYWQTGTSNDGTHISPDVGHLAMAPVLLDAIQHLVIEGGASGEVFQANFTPPTPAAPVNTVAPAITPGSCEAGGTLTCSLGTWTGYPAPTKTRQWKRNGSNITGQTSATYVTVDPTDVSAAITCAVTGTNTSGSASAGSNTVTPSAPAAVTDPLTTLGSKLHEWHTGDSLGSAASSIASWADGSGNSRVATEATNKPVVATDGGFKVAEFDGTQFLRCNYASFGGSLAAPYEVWILCKMLSGPHALAITELWSGYNTVLKWGAAASAPTDLVLNGGADLIVPDIDVSDGWHVLRCLVKSGASKIDMDGVQIASGNAGTGAFAGSSIGGGWSGPNANIRIREFFVVNAEATGGEVTALLAYMDSVTP